MIETSLFVDSKLYDIFISDLTYTNYIIDHNGDYGFGESATVITDINFDLIVTQFDDEKNEIDQQSHIWLDIYDQIKSEILDNYDFMKEWQEEEFNN